MTSNPVDVDRNPVAYDEGMADPTIPLPDGFSSAEEWLQDIARRDAEADEAARRIRASKDEKQRAIWRAIEERHRKGDIGPMMGVTYQALRSAGYSWEPEAGSGAGD